MFPISLSMVRLCLGWTYTDVVQGLVTTAVSSRVQLPWLCAEDTISM